MSGMRGRHFWWRVVALTAGLGLFACLYGFQTPTRLLVPVAAIEFALLVVGPLWRPDGLVPGAAALGALLWWVAGGPTPWWQAGLAALLLALFWVPTAWVAEVPEWAEYAPGLWARRIRYLLGFVASCVTATLVVALCLAMAPLPLSALWAAAGAAALLVGLWAAALVVSRAGE